ncbi:hypothetical protein DPMN_164369 [Dreissena polymorpha]|uniref:Uncharacterized protein n=1 Tax=Dreissena polymorpha TaxID=45954 RepID=A0A9D4EV10_DREPO|nr:hypothetical protein DPMN_164369 [Dreissena polymorpha]
MSVEDDATFLDAGIRPSAIMGGGVGIALEFVGKAVNFFTSMFKGDKKKDRVLIIYFAFKRKYNHYMGNV